MSDPRSAHQPTRGQILSIVKMRHLKTVIPLGFDIHAYDAPASPVPAIRWQQLQSVNHGWLLGDLLCSHAQGPGKYRSRPCAGAAANLLTTTLKRRRSGQGPGPFVAYLQGLPSLAESRTKIVITGGLMLAVPSVDLAISRSTELVQDPESIRKPRCLRGVFLSVNCWDWTKAIALPRVPRPRRLKIPRGQPWGLGAMP
jgi:hypothetical protein